jgi:hypothetical protein
MCVVGKAGGKLLVFVSQHQSTSASADYLLVHCAIWARVPTSRYLSGYRVTITLAHPFTSLFGSSTLCSHTLIFFSFSYVLFSVTAVCTLYCLATFVIRHCSLLCAIISATCPSSNVICAFWLPSDFEDLRFSYSLFPFVLSSVHLLLW